MNKKLEAFNPNDPGCGDCLFGMPFTVDEVKVAILPVPWEATVSYRTGTAQGPALVRNASLQVDLYDEDFALAWQIGIAMDEISSEWSERSASLRPKVELYLQDLTQGALLEKNSPHLQTIKEVNQASAVLNEWVKNESLRFLERGQLLGVLGGEHSSPLGLLHALSEKHGDFGILQIDAHADLRQAYEGFEFSHASIMYNALKLGSISKLVQVAVRDYAESEAKIINDSKGRIKLFSDRFLRRERYAGKSWKEICATIVSALPENVYVSFDIDGLDPKLCPNTGTPVPGGLEFEESLYLLEALVAQGKKIIGFDLCEVAAGSDGNEWDGNVAARLLFRLSTLMARSQGLIA